MISPSVVKRKNTYVLRAKIYEATSREIVRFFCIDRDAYQRATRSGMHRNARNRYLHGMRMQIVHVCAQQLPLSG